MLARQPSDSATLGIHKGTQIMFKRIAALHEIDPEVWNAIGHEIVRQEEHIELIASENYASPAVMMAQGSQLTNKYAEGYPGRRYYGGCEYVDVAETLAIERLKKLFGVQFANVQPHSGAQANQAVFLALLQPGDTFLGLSLAEGGHLTHGMALNLSGKWFKPVAYGLTKDEKIDYDAMRAQARVHKPKIIIGGGSAYSLKWDWKTMREIADEVGALLMTDVAHYAGLIAAGVYPSPVGHAHVITSTTHKTLRGPRGGIIMTNDEELAKKFNSAVFPGLQGGPLMHVIAAKAIAFGEALKPEFKTYQQNVLNNARALSDALKAEGLRIVSGGTESHLMLVDLRAKKITGKLAEAALGAAHITVNKNAIPNDPEKPMITSGIRVGSPAMTTRGFGTAEATQVGKFISRVLSAPEDEGNLAKVRADVNALCKRFPVYG
jgi:glycine hydroxymethyltransferase